MEVKEIQKIIDDWAKENAGYWEPKSMILRLMEEVGELAREVNHEFGQKPRKPEDGKQDFSDEVGDILFTLACFANSLGIDLEQSFKNVIEKYKTRDKNRHK